MKQCFKLDNLHKKITFEEVYNLLLPFGDITGYLAIDTSFIFELNNVTQDLLDINNLSLGGKRIKIERINSRHKLDTLPINYSRSLIFHLPEISLDDIKNECIRYGNVQEVMHSKEGIKVVCASETNARSVFLNMYGKFYNGKRLRCGLESN